MPDFAARTDSVNVQEIMDQIRARIREKRGGDDTDQQLQELGGARVAMLLDPGGARSDLIARLREARPPYSPQDLPNYTFEEHTLFESHRGPLRLIRKLLNPILKLFFNPNPLIQALNIQARLNAIAAERDATREQLRQKFDQVQYEALHTLVVENTRLTADVKNLKMRVESLTSRLEFNEKRARAIEGAVVYKPSPEDRLEPRETRRDEPSREPREARRDEGSREPREARRDEGSREPREGRESRELREPRDREPQTQATGASPASQQTPPAGPPAPAAEGQGRSGRRRRRRRGRRGGGAGPGMVGTGQAAPSSVSSMPDDAGASAASMDAGDGPEPDDTTPEEGGDWEAAESNPEPSPERSTEPAAPSSAPSLVSAEPDIVPDRTDSDPDQNQ